MKRVTIAFLVILCSCTFGCEVPSRPGIDPRTEIIYSSAFESSSDTIGWYGYGTIDLYPDSPPFGGRQCLHIAGSDTTRYPFAEKKLGTLEGDNLIILRFKAKSLDTAGGVLGMIAYSEELFPYHGYWYHYTDTGWQSFADTVEMWDGIDLRIRIIARSMLLDNVEVLKIRPEALE